MKIAYIAHIRFPSERAHAVQIVHMANAFSEAGHDVTLCVNTRATAITEPPEQYYGVSFLFTLLRVPIVDIIGHVHSFPRRLHALLFHIERLCFVLSFVCHGYARPFQMLYCRDEFILGCLSYIYTRKLLVWESHEGKDNFFARRLLRRVHTVVISEGIKEKYVALDFDAARISVAHDAVDDSFWAVAGDRAEIRTRLGITTDKPVVMYIGGLDAWKGVQTFFEAASRISQVQMVVIGGSEKEVTTLRTQYPHVQFLGAHPYRELAQNQRAADILVVPNTAKNTLSSTYTSPLKLFAHMTSQIPLVVSDIPSLRAVLDRQSAYFFTPDDPESLACVIEEVLSDSEEAGKRAQSAYETSKRYTWRTRAEEILKAITASKVTSRTT